MKTIYHCSISLHNQLCDELYLLNTVMNQWQPIFQVSPAFREIVPHIWLPAKHISLMTFEFISNLLLQKLFHIYLRSETLFNLNYITLFRIPLEDITC